MANSSTATKSMVIGSFDTTGASDSITVEAMRLVDVAINGDASWDGVIELQGYYRVGASNAYAWQAVDSYTSDTVVVRRVATERKLRLSATVTAGSATFELTAGNQAPDGYARTLLFGGAEAPAGGGELLWTGTGGDAILASGADVIRWK